MHEGGHGPVFILEIPMKSDPSQYLSLVAFADKTVETAGSDFETGYRIVA